MKRLVSGAWTRIRALAAVLLARQHTRRTLDRDAPRRILVVCYGNIYRSAFVGEFLSGRLGACVEVRSGGFHPVANRSSPARHIEFSARYGVSLEQHRSKVVTAADVQWAEAIVLMDRHNWHALRMLGADSGKFIWLGSLVPGRVEIPDPYNMDDERSLGIIVRMHDAAEALAKRIEARTEPAAPSG